MTNICVSSFILDNMIVESIVLPTGYLYIVLHAYSFINAQLS